MLLDTLNPGGHTDGNDRTGKWVPCASRFLGACVQVVRWGPPNRPEVPIAIPDRIWQKIDKTPTHWLWTGGLSKDGYAETRIDGKRVWVHRLTYEETVGPIPEGHHVDHVCRVRHCVRPHADHLEAVTPAENRRRQAEAVVECPRGHPYSGANLVIRPSGRRRCRECHRVAELARYHKGRRPNRG